MSLTTLVLDTPLSADQFKSLIRFADSKEAANDLAAFIAGMAGGIRSGNIVCNVGAARATGKFTVSSTGSSNDETCDVAGVTFTAKTSGATGNQFDISSTPATQAANMATAMAASPDLVGKVTVEAVGAEVRFTCVQPGVEGNATILTEGLTNVAPTVFAGGSDGDRFTISLD